ncbi:MAG: glycosyltransferase family 4 protein [Clostridiales bacterium]|nr:glycosyltransferase family 4 protein [Clostridiales bacterium]
MNILLINHYAGSPEMGMEFRPYYLAKEWVQMGHKVDIIAADYSHLRRKNPVISKDFEVEVIDGINYHWIHTRTYEGNGASRAITMAQFVGKLWINAKKIIKDLEPDTVICSSTYPLDTFVGQRIRKKSRKPVKLVHEVHDMWPATLYEIGGMSKRNPFVVAMQIGENSAYKKSDNVVSLLPFAEPYMKEHGLQPGKFLSIPNGVVEDEWSNPTQLPDKHKESLDRIHAQGKYIVGYFGGHALSNALDMVIYIADSIKDKDIHFVLVGNGVEKQRLVEECQRRRLENITFLDSIPKTAIPTLCENFDCIFMGAIESPLYRFGLCLNKMFDAMRAGKPILCAITTPGTYVEEYKCGIRVDSFDIEACINAIDTIKNLNCEDLELMSNNGKIAIKNNFTYEKLAKEFIKRMEK